MNGRYLGIRKGLKNTMKYFWVINDQFNTTFYLNYLDIRSMLGWVAIINAGVC